eukprot:4472128-Amphidinium_carterae.1
MDRNHRHILPNKNKLLHGNHLASTQCNTFNKRRCLSSLAAPAELTHAMPNINCMKRFGMKYLALPTLGGFTGQEHVELDLQNVRQLSTMTGTFPQARRCLRHQDMMSLQVDLCSRLPPPYHSCTAVPQPQCCNT